jgi:chromosome segregation ATPase
MKQIPVPQINGVAELLDLIVHPERLKETLQNMKDLHRAIVEGLGNLDSKEKIEKAVAEAFSARESAMKAKEEAERVLEESNAKAGEIVAQSQALLDEVSAERDSVEAKRKELDREIEAFRAEKSSSEALFSAQEDALRQGNIELDKKRSKFDADLADLNERISRINDAVK